MMSGNSNQNPPQCKCVGGNATLTAPAEPLPSFSGLAQAPQLQQESMVATSAMDGPHQQHWCFNTSQSVSGSRMVDSADTQRVQRGSQMMATQEGDFGRLTQLLAHQPPEFASTSMAVSLVPLLRQSALPSPRMTMAASRYLRPNMKTTVLKRRWKAMAMARYCLPGARYPMVE